MVTDVAAAMAVTATRVAVTTKDKANVMAAVAAATVASAITITN